VSETFKEAFGADSRIRTDDLIITNDLLYQLSYIGIGVLGRERRENNSGELDRQMGSCARRDRTGRYPQVPRPDLNLLAGQLPGTLAQTSAGPVSRIPPGGILSSVRHLLLQVLL
jgi:hypothetical protein